MLSVAQVSAKLTEADLVGALGFWLNNEESCVIGETYQNGAIVIKISVQRRLEKGGQAAEMAVLDEIETCHTESFRRRASDEADQQSCRADDVVLLFANQQACVKTVKNDDWLRFVHQLHSGPFRSSVTLPPPGGRRMCLFGRVSAGAVGVVFDRRALDLSKAFIWPSGYYAKTEFNISFDKCDNAEPYPNLTLALALALA